MRLMADRFTKMHGLGNDFVVIDAREQRVEMTPARAHAIADRRHGIACDQLILLEPSNCADVKLRIFNADGGRSEEHTSDLHSLLRNSYTVSSSEKTKKNSVIQTIKSIT